MTMRHAPGTRHPNTHRIAILEAMLARAMAAITDEWPVGCVKTITPERGKGTIKLLLQPRPDRSGA
jgi:hypothetical protein